MKKILVVVTYEAYVPEDMTVSQLQNNIEENIRNNFEDFRVTAEGYPEGEESEPLFDIKDIMVGTEAMISIGGE